MTLWLESGRVFRLHLLLIGLLLAAHVGVVGIRELTGHGQLLGLTDLFDFDVEANVPTLVSGAALLAAAGLFWSTGTAARLHGRSGTGYWRGLALVFVMLGVDEVAGVHERLSRPLREAMDLGGAFHFAWVLPYSLLVLVLAALYARFLLALDRRTLWTLVAAAALFLGGAVGMELVGGLIASAAEPDRRLFAAAVTLEEALEMTGVAVLIRALIAYNERHFGLDARGEPVAALAEPPSPATREALLTPQEALLILELRAQNAAVPTLAAGAAPATRVPRAAPASTVRRRG